MAWGIVSRQSWHSSCGVKDCCCYVREVCELLGGYVMSESFGSIRSVIVVLVAQFRAWRVVILVNEGYLSADEIDECSIR